MEMLTNLRTYHLFLIVMEELLGIGYRKNRYTENKRAKPEGRNLESLVRLPSVVNMARIIESRYESIR